MHIFIPRHKAKHFMSAGSLSSGYIMSAGKFSTSVCPDIKLNMLSMLDG